MATCVSKAVEISYPQTCDSPGRSKPISCCPYRYNQDQWAQDEFDCATLGEELEQAATTHIGGPCKIHRPESIPIPAARLHDPLIKAVKEGVKLGTSVAIAGAKLAQDIPIVRETSNFVSTNVKHASESKAVKVGARRVRKEANMLRNSTVVFLDGVVERFDAAKKLVSSTPKKEIAYKKKELKALDLFEGESRTGKEYQEDSEEEEESWEFV